MPGMCNLFRMPVMNIMGIDPSLTCLGFAYSVNGEQAVVGTVRPKKLKGLDRIAFIRDQVQEMFDEAAPELIAYEGYAMGRFAGGGRLADLGELGGVLKLMAFERKIPLLLVPPTCLKLFATGKGNADKDRVMAAMAKERGKLFSADDEADAYALYLMGKAFSDRRHRPRDPRHYRHTALRGCELVR